MIVRRLLLILIILTLAACVAVPRLTPQALKQAEQHFSEGRYTESAKLFTALAGQARGARRTELMLRAAAALAKANRTQQAKEILATVKVQRNNPHQFFLYRLSQSHVALAERRQNAVFSYLRQPPPRKTKRRYSAEHFKLRADAYTMQGNRLETARALVLRERYLDDPARIKENQRAIWEALATLTPRALQQLRTSPPPDVLSGWMHLVQIAKSYQLDPVKLQEQLRRWRKAYPKHPAQEDFVTGLSSRREEDVAHPNQLALLLPLSGKFASAANAVRDGFLAAYYSHPRHQAQTIRIYDIGSDPANILDVYKQAIAEGAEFIVGPLDKDAVTKLSNEEPLPVPTLALNYSQEVNSSPKNLYQFGLSPEEEARQVAQRAWLDGYVYAAALVPEGLWGTRVYNAFKEHWEYLGGKIVSQQDYVSQKSDFSSPIRNLLNINDSQYRYRQITTLLKRELKFSPRRRQDIDFIFLAAFPKQARAIRPQLKFFHASDVPVYATSHIFTGNLNQEKDRDMDGMLFGDMPWVLAETTSQRSIRGDIEKHISRDGHSFQRLYALGIDAFNIIGALRPLRSYDYERYEGETGSLSLDPQLRIQRQLTWVKFRSGQPNILDQAIR